MRVATFSVGGERRVGVVDASDRSVAPFSIPAREAAEGIVALLDKGDGLPATLSPSGFDSSAAAGAVPKHPIIFSKVPETVIPPAAEVVIDPAVSTSIDYEAELAVIIGRPGRGIP